MYLNSNCSNRIKRQNQFAGRLWFAVTSQVHLFSAPSNDWIFALSVEPDAF